MKITLFTPFLIIFSFFTASSQVGINNTAPKSSLDISASIKSNPLNTDGILIPRIDEFPSINPTGDQQSMLVYVTGSGTAQKGFYYWDNPLSSWIPFGETDHDWYEEATTTHPDNINKDIYTQGNAAIGKNTTDYKFDVFNEDTLRGINILNNNNNGLSPSTYSIHVENTNEGGNSQYGIKSLVSSFSGSGSRYASFNEITAGGSGNKYGTYNNILIGTGGDNYGLYNNFSVDSSDETFGVYTNIDMSGSGSKTGLENRINLTSLSSANVKGTSNIITAPVSIGVVKGVSNEIDVNQGSSDVDGLNNDIITQGGTGIISGVRNSLNTGTSSSSHYGIYNSLNHGTGSGDRFGMYSNVNGAVGTGSQYGIYSSTSEAGSYAGYFVGNVYTTGSYLPSARILKSNISRLNTSAIKKIMNLEVKTYRYNTKEFEFMNLPKGIQTGFIADEIQKEFPELVIKNKHPKQIEEGRTINEAVRFNAVNYTGLIPHLIKGIQEQQIIIENLDKENKALKKDIVAIKKMLEK